MDGRLHESWSRTRQALDAAVAAMPSPGKDDLAEYREYREHNELGLAFDVLVSVADQRDAGAACWTALREAAQEMGIVPSDPTHGSSAALVLSRTGG